MIILGLQFDCDSFASHAPAHHIERYVAAMIDHRFNRGGRAAM
jgi:hypothetical protein